MELKICSSVLTGEQSLQLQDPGESVQQTHTVSACQKEEHIDRTTKGLIQFLFLGYF